MTDHSFRYNRRGEHVIERMAEAAKMLDGQRLPYRELIGSRG